MVSEVAPQALAKLAMAAPQALAIATATLHAMATAAAGGDTATGDVMAAMPMAMMAMLIPIAAVLHLQLWNARCGLRLRMRRGAFCNTRQRPSIRSGWED